MKEKNKTKKSNFFRSISLALVFLVASAGCNNGNANRSGNQEYVTLKIWKPFMDSQEMQVLIGEYTAKNPFVQIEFSPKNIENYEEGLLNALAAGTGPDIFAIGNASLPKYLDKIQPAPEKAFTYRDYKQTFLDTVVEDFTQDNKVYGTAMAVDALALYYNKDLLGSNGFASPPKTWDELERQSRVITRTDSLGYFQVSGVSMGITQNVNRAQDILYLLMLQAGVRPWSSDRSMPTFTQSVERNGRQVNPGEKGLGFYTSFSNPKSQNYTWNSASDYSIDAFANGRSAFMYGYSFARPAILDKAPNLNFDVSEVPQANLTDPKVNFSNYFGEVVSNQSKNADIAWDFLKFITSKQILENYNKEYKYVSSRRDVVSSQLTDPIIGVFASASLTARNFYRPNEEKVDNIMLRAIDNVSLRGLQPDEALRQAEQQAGTLSRDLY